jgi:hypothetical protein
MTDPDIEHDLEPEHDPDNPDPEPDNEADNDHDNPERDPQGVTLCVCVAPPSLWFGRPREFVMTA